MEYYFVTGSSKGIGKALVNAVLARQDVHLTGLARTNTVDASGFTFVQLDLSDENAVAAYKFPPCPDATKIVLVNNAGALGQTKRVGRLSDAHFQEVIGINLTAVMILSNQFLAAFSEAKVPLVILNISSGAGKNPIDGWAAYCASKAGLDMFSRVVAEELRIADQQHIRIFSVGPGVVDTNMQDQIRQASESDFSRIHQFIEYKSSGQLADPDLIARKLLSILDAPEKYPETVFSAKDIIT